LSCTSVVRDLLSIVMKSDHFPLSSGNRESPMGVDMSIMECGGTVNAVYDQKFVLRQSRSIVVADKPIPSVPFPRT